MPNRGPARTVIERWPNGEPIDSYGHRHRPLRKRWAEVVDRGEAVCCATRCLQESRKIFSGMPWDLAHTADRRGYAGPAQRGCNQCDAWPERKA